jgi:hypothetical protein
MGRNVLCGVRDGELSCCRPARVRKSQISGPLPFVMVGLVPTIHLSASSGTRFAMDPRDKPEDDKCAERGEGTRGEPRFERAGISFCENKCWPTEDDIRDRRAYVLCASEMRRAAPRPAGLTRSRGPQSGENLPWHGGQTIQASGSGARVRRSRRRCSCLAWWL